MENHGHEEQGTSAMDHQEARKHTLERQVESTGALQESRNWSMGLHLSMLAGLVIPFAGLVAPIVIWQTKKDQYPELDAHGKMATNFMISMCIYFFISFLLMFVLIGIPMVFAALVVSVIYPIVGGIKASNGELWGYPGIIKFLK